MSKRPQFQVSADTQVLAARLSKCEIGQTMTYADLAQMVNLKPDDDKFRTRLFAARKRVQKEHGMFFGTVQKVGVQRQHPDTLPEAVMHKLRRIHRSAHGTTRFVKQVTTKNSLSDSSARRVAAAVAVAGVISHMTKPSELKQFATVQNNAAQPALDQLKARF